MKTGESDVERLRAVSVYEYKCEAKKVRGGGGVESSSLVQREREEGL